MRYCFHSSWECSRNRMSRKRGCERIKWDLKFNQRNTELPYTYGANGKHTASSFPSAWRCDDIIQVARHETTHGEDGRRSVETHVGFPGSSVIESKDNDCCVKPRVPLNCTITPLFIGLSPHEPVFYRQVQTPADPGSAMLTLLLHSLPGLKHTKGTRCGAKDYERRSWLYHESILQIPFTLVRAFVVPR
jgi:hypothetical protein